MPSSTPTFRKRAAATTTPPKNVNDYEKFMDFNEPDKDNPFGFFGLTFGEFGQAEPQGPSKPVKVGIALADVKSGHNEKKSGRGRRTTLEWWKAYLDSCASYHTFLSRRSSRTSKKAVAR